MPTNRPTELEVAREYVEDACAFYPHGDGPLITFEERVRVLAALLTRREREAVAAAKPEIEAPWRKLAALGHACVAPGMQLYTDDGELQCSACMIDFRRDSIEHIEARIIALVAVRMESQAKRKAEIERKAKVEALEWAQRYPLEHDALIDPTWAQAIEAEIAKLEGEPHA